MNRITPIGTQAANAAARQTHRTDQKGIHDIRSLPDSDFDGVWDSIILSPGLKDRLLAQAVLNFTARGRLQRVHLPVHGIILMVGPPGTGKTSLARGLASAPPLRSVAPSPSSKSIRMHLRARRTERPNRLYRIYSGQFWPKSHQ